MDKEILSVLECPLCKQIMEFVKKFVVSEDVNDRIEFLRLVSESKEIYVKFINFADSLTRDSETYKILTQAHMWGLKNDKNYKNVYYDVANGDTEGLTNPRRTINPDPYLQGEL